MNRYGLLAQETWTRHAPARVAAMTDPEEFFTMLGEDAAAQIETLTQAMERDLREGMPYLERVGQLRTIRRQAEETVLRDLVFGPIAQEQDPELLGRVEELLGRLPTREMISERIAEIRRHAREAADLEGRAHPVFSAEEEQELHRLQGMLPWVQLNPEDMSQEQLLTAEELLSSLLP